MNKIMKCAAVFAAITFSVSNVSAQETFGNAGLEFAFPVGDWAKDVYGIGIGGSGGMEFGMSDNFAITGNVGITFFSVNEDVSDLIKSTFMVPIQVGGRYYFDEQRSGLFAEANLGLHIFSVSTEEIDLGPLGTIESESTSETYFSLAPQVGYFVNENISISLRYQLVFQGEQEEDFLNPITGDTETVTVDGQNLGYIGLKLGYHF
jgi:hypothetical protein